MSAFPILQKPRFGDACNRCGYCCRNRQCDVSHAVFGDQDLCPALEQYADGTTSCALMTHPLELVVSMAPEAHRGLIALAVVSAVTGLTESIPFGTDPAVYIQRWLRAGEGCNSADRTPIVGLDADLFGVGAKRLWEIYLERVAARQ